MIKVKYFNSFRQKHLPVLPLFDISADAWDTAEEWEGSHADEHHNDKDKPLKEQHLGPELNKKGWKEAGVGRLSWCERSGWESEQCCG